MSLPSLTLAVSVSPLKARCNAALGANRSLPGVLTALTQPSPDALRTAIRETRAATDKPFGVNITLLPSINPPDYEGYARVAVEEGVRIFETAGNNREFRSYSKYFSAPDNELQRENSFTSLNHMGAS